LQVSVVRLVTYATLRELTSSSYSVRLRHVARLADGREILRLDDRGFSAGSSSPGIILTREQVELDARTCVGPDEPVDPETWTQAEAQHATVIAERLRVAGVTIDADEVHRLEHDVVLDERLRAAVA
jgi:hypothetical protein